MNCSKCKDTGTARWGGFYEHRGPTVLCDCPAGVEAQSWAALTPEQARERGIREGAALREAERAARLARRAAREAAAL